ncbi:hypothetical protein ACLI4R_04850 [Natrialbaceae archaeon A-chndr2]
MRDLCESDVEVLETLVTDGGEQHPQQIANNTERGISTIYRALERLHGIFRNEGASVSFASKKYEQEIAAIVESTEHQIENAADRAAKILDLETRQAALSAWQKWCQKYAAKITDVTDENQPTVRIDTILSRLKSTSYPNLQEVLSEGVDDWHRDGRDPGELLEATVKWRAGGDAWEVGKVKPTLR